ncbi:hypothetical protein [Actinomycetospora chiangmaiensis]|uniref:hypothetical protein n=1 Tax=Actinomycetospora chiangmaiensis TaxID=402650 RepID=UPI00039BA6A2|nr:hypothetical protein [Actinomycetospora chiangmaiensis]
MAYAGRNATATASSAQNGSPASVTCGGGPAYAANQNGHTFCVSGKYYSFTYAPNKIDLTLDLPTAPPKKSSSSSSTVQKTSNSTGTSSGKGSSSKDSASTKSSSSGSEDSSSGKSSSSGSTSSRGGSTKLVTLTKKN